MATYWENSCSFGLRYVSWYKYLIVSLVFSHLGFWSGNLFLIAPFPDLCLLVPFFNYICRVVGGRSFHHERTETRSSRVVIARLVGAFVFATLLVRSLCYLIPKFQAFCHLLHLTGRFGSDLVGEPEKRFSRVTANILVLV